MIFNRIPTERINWVTSSFLIGTLALTLTAVPLYLWNFGLNWFQVILFVTMFYATGMSITLGYHRLFSHNTFKAKWPVKLFTLLFGAAAFENSVLMWASEHRDHHKHVDHDDDPYAISKGFFFAHIGWLLFKLNPEEGHRVSERGRPPEGQDGDVAGQVRPVDRRRGRLRVPGAARLRLPAHLGRCPVGGFLFGGVARVVAVQHCTFFINSACHTFGNQPYSVRCSARDSWLMAFFTFGEGYHNYHHEFQHDYRNGVKPWQWDPTKWAIWLFAKLGLTDNLRRVPSEKIILAQIIEAQRTLEEKLAKTSLTLPESTRTLLQASHDYLTELNNRWAVQRREYLKATEQTLEHSREKMAELREEMKMALAHLKFVRTIEAAL